jgi:hypothetical protein
LTSENEKIKNQHSEVFLELKKKNFQIEELNHRIRGLEEETKGGEVKDGKLVNMQ